jgi:hypothetical protein
MPPQQPPSPALLALFLQATKSQFPGLIIGGIVSPLVLEALRQWIFRPRVSLEFQPDAECISWTREHGRTMGPEWRVCYVRMKVTNGNWRSVKNCKAYLVKIEKQDEQGKYTPTTYSDGLQLAWSARGTQDALAGIDIPQKVPQFVDVISVREISHAFRPEVGVVLARHEALWQERGVFRATVAVSGENCKTVQRRICFEWEGDLNTLRIWQSWPRRSSLDIGCSQETYSARWRVGR